MIKLDGLLKPGIEKTIQQGIDSLKKDFKGNIKNLEKKINL